VAAVALGAYRLGDRKLRLTQEHAMIVVRDIFQLQFGKARQATELWKQAMEVLGRAGFGGTGFRLLTDLAGPPYYTLVLESTWPSLAQWEAASKKGRTDPQWKALYARICELTESGRREVLALVT
jgi:hypothetical protein